MNRGWWFAWDRLSIYLPLLVMGLLALGTYWLVQNSPKPEARRAERPLRHEPDYFMENFSVTTYVESGRVKSEVFGARAKHFPDTETLEIERVRIRSYDDQGRLTTATANNARTNSDASEVELIGDARVVREASTDAQGVVTPRMEFRGEYLHAFIDAERVTSDKPVELRRGGDVFVADSLEYDDAGRTVVLQGRVKGQLLPKGK